MPNKERLPRFPSDYKGEKAFEYDSLKWMERNQKKTTEKCIQFLYDEKLGKINSVRTEDKLVIDLGCGTGFSSEVLLEHGFKVIGIEILEDMLLKVLPKKFNLSRSNDRCISLILADIRFLPIRETTINYGISVSAYNFITHGVKSNKEKEITLNKTAKNLFNVLKPNGRVIIEFYPKDEEELNLFIDSFVNNGFQGFMVKGDPDQKGGQTFLLLIKEKNR
jgi:SAM-dependent methyltransferase